MYVCMYLCMDGCTHVCVSTVPFSHNTGSQTVICNCCSLLFCTETDTDVLSNVSCKLLQNFNHFWQVSHKLNLPSQVECLQYNNRLHMSLCFINFSRHSIIVHRAHGTGLIILTQNSSSNCNTIIAKFVIHNRNHCSVIIKH